jgi:hypothetical protein
LAGVYGNGGAMSRQPQHVSNPWAPQRQGKASNINRLHATHNSTYLWDPPTRCSLRLIAAISGPAKHTSQTQDRVKPPRGACRALRMHCIRCGDVASKKSRPMDTHDATHRYLAPKTAETYPHTAEPTDARLSKHEQVHDYFSQSSPGKHTSPKFCDCAFPGPITGHGKWVER